MGPLFGKLDDFEFKALAWLCGGCTLASALFLLSLIVGMLIYGMRRDRPPPSD